jgi:hypothetical protein
MGCQQGPNYPTISGKVAYNGEPVASGEISFQSVDGATPSASSIIRDGSYHVQVPPGKKKVIITGTKVTGSRPAYEGDPQSPLIELTEQYLPAEYNERTTLERDVASSATLDFDLRSTTSGS